MVKKKFRKVSKKKLHPLLAALIGFFAVVLLAVLVVGHAYKDVSPLQEVAGTHDAISPSITKSITPSTGPSCLVMMAVRGISPCGKDSYKGVTVICGDGSQPKIITNNQCASLTSWATKLAQVCAGHSSCRPSGTPTPRVSTSPKEIHGKPLQQTTPKPTITIQQ